MKHRYVNAVKRCDYIMMHVQVKCTCTVIMQTYSHDTRKYVLHH